MSIITENNEPLTQSDGKVYSDIPNGENDFYYRRYRDDGNNKFYINSRYLKNAIIDGSNNISEIESSVPDQKNIDTNIASDFYLLAGTNKPILTNKGINIPIGTSTAILRNRATGLQGIYAGQPDNIWFSFWFRADRVPQGFTYFLEFNTININLGGNNFQTLFGWNLQANKLFIRVSGVGDYYSTMQLDHSNYYHVSFAKIGGAFKYFINGIYEFSLSAPSYTDDITLNLKTWENPTEPFTLDDFYCTLKGIDLINSAIGDKVFEPPERGGFDSIIKQY